MAQQQFTDTFRECLWRTHGQRCFYCDQPIRFIDFEVDHLFPEYLINNPKELGELLTKYGLDSNFDIKSHENLAPSCAPCNSKKGDIILPVGQVAILLAKIASKLDGVTKCIERKQQERSLGSILLSIGKAIDKKVFSKAELFNALKMKGYIDLTGGTGLVISSKEIVTTRDELNINLETKEISWSKHALLRMAERNILISEVTAALLGGVNVESISLYREDPISPKYKVRTHTGIEIIFTVDGDRILVLTCFGT